MAKPKIDYRSFTGVGKGPSDDETPKAVTRWWLAKTDDELVNGIEQTVGHIKAHSSPLEAQRQTSARMYSNSTLTGVNGKPATQPVGQKGRISYNVVQSCIDTIVAKIAKNKPRPLFLTSGADWSMQRRAKNLDKFVEGVFYENDAYRLGANAFRDGCVFGDGVLHVFTHNKRIKFERVLSSEIYVDEIDGFYNNPRQMHRAKVIDRQVLKEMFPDSAKEIEEISATTDNIAYNHESISDPIQVIESWHLRSGEEADDGYHAISAGNVVLIKEEYERDRFPFAFLPWSKRLYGFWSQGLAEQIQPIQLEINKLLWVIQRSMHLAGTFKIWVGNASKIVKEHLNNDIGTIITGNEAPQYLNPPIVQPEIYQHLTTLKNAAYEQAGVSQLSASSQKPMGLDSGKALREFNDIESDRFAIVGQAYENFFLDLAHLVVEEAKYINDTYGDLTVNAPSKYSLDKIHWSDVDMQRDQFSMKVYPVSSLPEDPEGRLQTIQEYTQAGFMSPATGRRLLDFPDLNSEERLANAPEDRIHKIFGDIVDKNEYTPPDSFMDLQSARKLALEYYNYGAVAGLDEIKLESFRTFLSQLDAMDAQMQAAMAPPQGAPGAPGASPQGIPPADPTQAPQSDLVPNTNQAA